jgi:hypothetical protein
MTRPDLTEPHTCEVDDCDHPRGAALRSIYHYGCVLCVWHEDLYQEGEIDLPDTRSDKRQASAEEIILA